MAEPIDEIRHRLEEPAAAMFLYAGQDLWLASMALSAKRSADALEKIASMLGGEGDTAALHHTIGSLAWEAGRNFQAGLRTDR